MDQQEMIREVERFRGQLMGLIYGAISAGSPTQASDWLCYLAGAEILAHHLGLMEDNLDGRLKLSDRIFDSMLPKEGE